MAHDWKRASRHWWLTTRYWRQTAMDLSRQKLEQAALYRAVELDRAQLAAELAAVTGTLDRVRREQGEVLDRMHREREKAAT